LANNLAKCRPNRGAVAALMALLGLAAAPSPTLVGKWKLVEQRYGSGNANLASLDAPVRLEFFASGGRLVGRIWAGEDPTRALQWPALLTEHGAHPLDIRQITIDPGANLARAVYRPRPSSPDGEPLEIVEEYRVAEEGAALLGTVTIRSLGSGGTTASYVLKRRFEKIP
jgi:hypothetical protein